MIQNKNYIVVFLLAMISSQSCKPGSFGSVAQAYVCSPEGARDALAAYGLGMVLSLVHESWHALMAKKLRGAPIDITLGALPDHRFEDCNDLGGWSNPPYVYTQVGCIKLGGFNPAIGFAVCETDESSKIEAEFYDLSPQQPSPSLDALNSFEKLFSDEAKINLAGPIAGFAGSCIALGLLCMYTERSYMAKFAAAYGIFNHSVGLAGLLGFAACRVMKKESGHDLIHAWENRNRVNWVRRHRVSLYGKK